jgi:biotin carboxyl carrier protein
MYKVKVDQEKEFEIHEKDSQYSLNQKDFDWDIIRLNEHYFHIIKDNKSYKAELIKADIKQKNFLLKINGRQFTVDAKDRFDLLLNELGMSDLNAAALNDLKAPMPGLILEVMVQEGTVVKKGDPLLILEAMKMENVIKASGEGEVKNIKIKKGDSVEKNQLLIEF